MAYIVDIAYLRFSEQEVYVKGDRIDLSPKLVKNLIKKAYIKFDTESRKTVVSVEKVQATEKLIPEGNVETVKDYISGIEDVELLEKMAEEELSDKNRKTVIEAIYERAQELAEDDEESNDDEALKINFNPEDVIDNG